jgi:TonB family protein
MKQCDATLSKAMAFSVAVHIAVFGGALAFAHYGGAGPGEAFRAITVSLVGTGVPGTADRPRKSLHHRPRETDAAPVRDEAVVPPAVDTAQGEETASEGTLAPPGTLTGPAIPPPAGSGGSAEQQGSGSAALGLPGGAGESGMDIQMEHLQSAIEKAKTYPRLARERGIEGTVLVRFKVLPSGNIETVNVVKSSGTPILDEASVKTVYRAAPMPYVSGWVEVPMVYELR